MLDMFAYKGQNNQEKWVFCHFNNICEVETNHTVLDLLVFLDSMCLTSLGSFTWCIYHNIAELFWHLIDLEQQPESCFCCSIDKRSGVEFWFIGKRHPKNQRHPLLHRTTRTSIGFSLWTYISFLQLYSIH